MITVIHLRDSAFVGGPEKQILGQCKLLDRSRFSPRVVSFSTSGKNALTEAAASEGIPAACLPDGKLASPRAVLRFRSLLRESENPLVVTSGFKADVIAWLACGSQGVPWIAWFHGYTAFTCRVRLYETLDLRVLRGASCVMALCERTAAQLRRSGIVNVNVVPNGIDVVAVRSTGDRRSARHALGIGEHEVAIGTISRLSEEKGLDVFIECAAGLLRSCPNARFPIVGDGPLEADLRRQAERTGFGSRFIFTGFRKDAVALLKGFDVFVLPSRRENQPVALLEAMACGISVVATDVGGVGDILAGTPVAPVPPGSPGELTSAILMLVQDHNLRTEQQAAMLKRVKDFSFERHVEAAQAVYEAARMNSGLCC